MSAGGPQPGRSGNRGGAVWVVAASITGRYDGVRRMLQGYLAVADWGSDSSFEMGPLGGSGLLGNRRFTEDGTT